jgi:hypothetical protein
MPEQQLDQAPFGAANSNEWDEAPLKAYPLHDFNYRRAFLSQVYWRGEDCLFEAVSHLWNSLKPPKDYRNALILHMSGFSGSGKAQLMAMLKSFVMEGVATISPIPPPAEFADLEQWNAAISETTKQDEKALGELVERWTYLLNAEQPPNRVAG